MHTHDIKESGTNDDNVDDSSIILVGVSNLDRPCTKHHNGSSGAMESDGIVLMYKTDIFLEYIATNDNTEMKKYISHAKYRPNIKKNINTSIPDTIPKSNWYVDPAHQVHIAVFFELTK